MIAYYNFITCEYDHLDNPPDDWTTYIPQYPEAINLYKCYLELNYSRVEAAIKVLEICAGKNVKGTE